MDISTITDIKEIKVMAYDQLVLREQADNNLRMLNQRLNELAQQDPAAVAEDTSGKS